MCDHNLAIEKGRYLKVPREQRLCVSCNVVEDEAHFLLHCKTNESLRKKLIEEFFENTDHYEQYNDNQKLKILLNPNSYKQVYVISSYLKQSLVLRTGDS